MMRIANHYVSKAVFSLIFIDFIILMSSFYAGAAVRLSHVEEFMFTPRLDHFLASALSFAAAIIFSMSAIGVYQLDQNEGLRNSFYLKLMPAYAMGFCILTLVFYLVPELYFGRGILMSVFAMSAAGIVLTRLIFFKTSERGILEQRILVLGDGPLAKECGELALRSSGYQKYNVAGFVPVPTDDPKAQEKNVLPVERVEPLASIARRYGANEIVVSVANRRGGKFPIRELLDCKLSGIRVTDAASFIERETCQIRVDSLQPSWLVFGGGFDQSFIRAFMKRAFDIVVSTIIMALTLPIMLITAICIWWEDRGPLIYRQERVGMGGKTFYVMKFRSMGINAEKPGTPQWAAANDPRVTRVGGFIRKVRIDELPQLVNVFKGEMSFVGPRPERPFFVEQLSAQIPYYQVRHSIKPGITGWAQVRYGYGATVEDAVQKLQYDLYYVKNNSLFLDVLILIDTVKVVLFGAGR